VARKNAIEGGAATDVCRFSRKIIGRDDDWRVLDASMIRPTMTIEDPYWDFRVYAQGDIHGRQLV
jgi:hypothetical protein